MLEDGKIVRNMEMERIPMQKVIDLLASMKTACHQDMGNIIGVMVVSIEVHFIMDIKMAKESCLENISKKGKKNGFYMKEIS